MNEMCGFLLRYSPMIYGPDVEPQHDPVTFLGSMGLIGVLGGLGFLRWVPRYIARPEAR